MVYKFRIISDEVDNFYRDIEILGSQTFYQFHKLMQDDLGWDSQQMASFFVSNIQWEKIREITLYEMDMDGETDAVVMDVAAIDEFVKEEKQRLLYVFDIFNERLFFIELIGIFPINKELKYPVISDKLGDGPEQSSNLDVVNPYSGRSIESDVRDLFEDYKEDDDIRLENIDDYDL